MASAPRSGSGDEEMANQLNWRRSGFRASGVAEPLIGWGSTGCRDEPEAGEGQPSLAGCNPDGDAWQKVGAGSAAGEAWSIAGSNR